MRSLIPLGGTMQVVKKAFLTQKALAKGLAGAAPRPDTEETA